MKQHRLITVLSAALLGLSAAASLPALPGAPAGIVAEAATTSNGLVYTVQNGEVTITGYTGTSVSVTIPSYIGGKPVRTIGDEAFYFGPYATRKLTSVSIPNTVHTIGDMAFYENNLTTLVLPASVTEIGWSAFCSNDYLTSVEIKGNAHIGEGAFQCCSALQSVKLQPNTTAGENAFSFCTSLNMLNGIQAFRCITDPNGSEEWYPMISQSQNTRKILRNVFLNSTHVKFMTDYSSVLSNYIVNTEIRDWMSDNVKARVLYDWLIEHCAYEDDPTKLHDAKNHSVDSLFFSYGLDFRGPGVGETVCEGYAKTYTTLLAMAGVESYVLDARPTVNGTDGHAWNLVKIEDKYYECDVTWDRGFYVNNGAACNYGTAYQYFLLDSAAMANLHRDEYGNLILQAPHVLAYPGEPYLDYDHQVGNEHLAECIYNFNDTNYDGLLDWDWNFDGTADWNDLAYNALIRDLCNVSYVGIESQPDFLNNLLLCNMSPEYWYSIA